MQDLWQYLKETPKPVLLYGMGNGADKILEACAANGIAVSDIFASDEFVRGQKFHGKTVLRYSEAVEKYGKFIVLVSFGTCLDPVLSNIRKISSEQELYAPDVPVAGSTLFTSRYYSENKAKFEKARSLLEDEKSKKVFDEIIAYKLDGRIEHFAIDSDQDEDLKGLNFGGYSDYIDLGAFNGDTIEEYLHRFPSIRHVIAFEPSARVYKKLCVNMQKYPDISLDLYNLASSDKEKENTFSDGAGRNTKRMEENVLDPHQGKTTVIRCNSVDNVCSEKNHKMLLKIDVEGDEKESLEGSENILRSNCCDLVVSAYHRSEDLFAIPLQIKELLPNCKLYLRKHKYIPAWDINLYVKG